MVTKRHESLRQANGMAAEPLPRIHEGKKSLIIDKQNYSMKMKELSTLIFSAAC
jgi:hypothetical protein